MQTKSSKIGPLSFLPVLCVAVFAAVPAFPQNSHETEVAAAVQTESPIARLIPEAKEANTPEGSKKYAQRLAEMFIGDRAGEAYLASFSRRLAKADLEARRGQRKWIPEGTVAQAFNSLMRQVSGATGGPFQTDSNVVHRTRLTLAETTPVLTTVKSHDSECQPGEAVFLMNQLLLHNGSLEDRCPPQPGPDGSLVQHACAEKDGPAFASLLVSRYSRSHSRLKNEMLFDLVVQLFSL